MQLIKKDVAFAEKASAKWRRETDPTLINKTAGAYTKIFKPVLYVPDKGIETVIEDLASRRSIPKEFLSRPDLFRDNGPRERVLSRQ